MKAQDLRGSGKKCQHCKPAEVPLSWQEFFAVTAVFAGFSLFLFYLVSTTPPQKLYWIDTVTTGVADLLLILASVVAVVQVGYVLIGSMRHHFTDEDGYEHTHRLCPTDVNSPWHVWWSAHPPYQVCVELRYGGIFRKSRVVNPNADLNLVVKNWRGDKDVRLVEYQDTTGYGPRSLNWGLPTTLHLLRRYRHMMEIVQSAEGESANIRVREQAFFVRDRLGVLCWRLLLEIQGDRTRLGRSQHAVKIRLLVERELERLGVDFQRHYRDEPPDYMEHCHQRWVETAQQQFLASAEQAKTDAAAASEANASATT